MKNYENLYMDVNVFIKNNKIYIKHKTLIGDKIKIIINVFSIVETMENVSRYKFYGAFKQYNTTYIVF